jgi:membrane protein YqaA with SNARE-associated domain
MAPIKKSLARKAVKSTAKHTAHGTASKLRRDPLRATTLLGLGAVAGGFAGWLLGRTGSATAATVS